MPPKKAASVGKKADPKKAETKKADPKKADPKKADPKKAETKKIDTSPTRKSPKKSPGTKEKVVRKKSPVEKKKGKRELDETVTDRLEKNQMKDLIPDIKKMVYRDEKQKDKIEKIIREKVMKVFEDQKVAEVLDLDKVVEKFVDLYIERFGLYFKDFMDKYGPEIKKFYHEDHEFYHEDHKFEDEEEKLEPELLNMMDIVYKQDKHGFIDDRDENMIRLVIEPPEPGKRYPETRYIPELVVMSDVFGYSGLGKHLRRRLESELNFLKILRDMGVDEKYYKKDKSRDGSEVPFYQYLLDYVNS
jgi:hypothetical protein